jgi:putative tryptophan/tyrosine transport system substrate-binding protein
MVYGDRDEKRLHAVAAELVARRPDVIYLQGNVEAGAAFAQTRTIPIVFSAVVDPVAAGLIKSLQQPGGNVTGVSTIGWELGDKRMQLLQEALPNAKRVATLVYSPSPLGAIELALLKRAAGTRVLLIPMTVSHSGALNEVLSTLGTTKADAMIIPHSSFLMSERRPVIAAATKLGLPVIAHRSELADDGALMTYSSNLMDQIRRAAHLVDKVLKGTKPSDIPVELPTTFELVVNLKTAKALGITIPQAMLLQASRVIE